MIVEVSVAVLGAVLAELDDAGLEGLSVEKLARRAEVNKTTVYRRWPTRDDLVSAALHRAAAAIAANRLPLARDLDLRQRATHHSPSFTTAAVKVQACPGPVALRHW